MAIRSLVVVCPVAMVLVVPLVRHAPEAELSGDRVSMGRMSASIVFSVLWTRYACSMSEFCHVSEDGWKTRVVAPSHCGSCVTATLCDGNAAEAEAVPQQVPALFGRNYQGKVDTAIVLHISLRLGE